MMNKIILLSIFFLTIINYSYSETDDYDYGPFDSNVNREVGAREIGMAKTGVADAENINAWYWNPAGLLQINGEYITDMHINTILGVDLSHYYLGYGRSIGEYSAFGIYLMKFDFDLIYYPWRDDALVLSYATLFPEYPDLYLGLNAKFVYTKVEYEGGGGDKTRGIGADLGLIYRYDDKLKIGMLLRNIYNTCRNESAEGDSYEEKQQPQLILGLSYKIDATQRVNLDLQDFDKKLEGVSKPQIKIGYEKFIDEPIALRIGYILSKKSEENGLFAGVGFRIGPWQLDYAYEAPHSIEDIQPSHHLSLIFEIK